MGYDFGKIIFGGADMKYKQNINEEFSWAPLINKEFYAVRLLSFKKVYKDK